MARPGYTMPANLITEEELEEYTDEELGLLFRAIIKARAYDQKNAANGLTRELKRLLRSVADYDDVAKHNYEVNVQNGQKGGRPKTQKNPTKPTITQVNPTKPIEIEIENEIEIEDIYKEKSIKEKDGAKAPASPRMTRPTLLEVKDYIQEKGYLVSAEQWYDFYEANGWKVGRNPMKDWKACIRSWEQRERKEQANRPKTNHEEFLELYEKARIQDEEEERRRRLEPAGRNDPFGLPFPELSDL